MNTHKNWATDTHDLPERIPPLREGFIIFSNTLLSRKFGGWVSTKQTKHIINIMCDVNDTDNTIIAKLLNYSKKQLAADQQLCSNHEKLGRFPAEKFTKRQIRMLKFQQTNAYLPHILRCILKDTFRNHSVRNNWLLLMAGTKSQQCAFCERLPVTIRYLFKPQNPYSGNTMWLAIVPVLEASLVLASCKIAAS